MRARGEAGGAHRPDDRLLGRRAGPDLDVDARQVAVERLVPVRMPQAHDLAVAPRPARRAHDAVPAARTGVPPGRGEVDPRWGRSSFRIGWRRGPREAGADPREAQGRAQERLDQRGAGRSRYMQRLFANTTQHLIGDMERIRAELEIDRWVIVGGSWGATLALAYAERHPKHVIGLVLRAVFLGTRRELEWAFLDGLARFRPELYEAFLDALSALERADPLEAYWRRILDPDPAIHRHSAWLWHDVERALSELVPASPMPPTDPRDGLPSTPFIEAHYFRSGCFLRPGELLDNASLLASIPGIIVQGRYDMLCPPQTAAALAKRWGNARIDFVEGAGHAISEPGIRDALINGIREVGFPAA